MTLGEITDAIYAHWALGKDLKGFSYEVEELINSFYSDWEDADFPESDNIIYRCGFEVIKFLDSKIGD